MKRLSRFNVNILSELVLLLITRILLITCEETIQVNKATIQCDDEHPSEFHENLINLWKPFTGPKSESNQKSLATWTKNDIYKNLQISLLRFCTRHKLSLTLQLTNDNRPSTSDGTIIRIDHALDEQLGNQIQFGQPIALKIQQGPIFQMHPLHYAFTVNAQPFEEIHNADNTPNFNSCQDFDKSSICGYETDESGHEYRRGYCCECDRDDGSGSGSCTAKDSPSVHCYKENEYWYSLHELGTPESLHQVFLQMYRFVENETAGGGISFWKNIGNQSIHVDSIGLSNYEEANGDNETLRIVYVKNVNSSDSLQPYLNLETQVVLIPNPNPAQFLPTDPNTTTTVVSPKPIQSNSVEDSYLVVPSSSIDHTGTICNKAGVGPLAYVRQPNRCKNTASESPCLQNQPFDLWTQDGETSKPHYRLKYFGKIHTPAPIKIIDKTIYLVLEQPQKLFTSSLAMQYISSSFQLLAPDYSATILSAIIDSNSTHAKFIIEIGNTDLISAKYRLKIVQCGREIPDRSTKEKLIQAQKMGTFTINTRFREKLIEKVSSCRLIVFNQRKELIATRRLMMVPGDACICYLDCECTCSKESLKCVKMIKIDLIAAGIRDMDLFRSGVESSKQHFEALIEAAESHPIPTIILIIIFLLLLGFCKGMLGKCCQPVNVFGLGYFYDRPRRLNKYFEKAYSRQDVVHDDDGYPLDPFTRLPTVQRMSSNELLALNTVIFVTWPCLCCHWTLHWCCGCCSPTDEDDDEAGDDPDQSNKKRKGRVYWRRGQKAKPRVYHRVPENEDVHISIPKLGEDEDEVQLEKSEENDEVVHFDRTKKAVTSEQYRLLGIQSGKHAEEDEQMHKQYGSSFFRDSDSALGSPNLPSRKDSNMSVTNIKESTSAEYKYRRTSAGQQEYATRFGPGSKFGAWHRNPSDWSVGSASNLVEEAQNKKLWSHQSEVSLN